MTRAVFVTIKIAPQIKLRVTPQITLTIKALTRVLSSTGHHKKCDRNRQHQQSKIRFFYALHVALLTRSANALRHTCDYRSR
jgi:hypothetical protein